jgi:ATP-dependent RNA helicase RhlE
MLHDIERLIKREIAVEVIAGFEPDPNAKAQPIQLRSQEHRQQRKPQGQGRGQKPAAPKQGAPRPAAPKPSAQKPAGAKPTAPKPNTPKPAQGANQAKPAAPRPPQPQQAKRPAGGSPAKLLGGSGSHKPAAPHRSGGRGR